MKTNFFLLILSLSLFLLPATALAQQGTSAFNYQGQIFDAGGQPITDQCDFVFEIHDSETGLTPLASLQIDAVPVTDGLFSVSIDFGTGVFDGSPRWLEAAVRCGSEPAFDSLGRLQILSSPYAAFAYGVDWANVKNRPTYSAGSGLALTGTEFSIPSAYQLPQNCAGGAHPVWTGSAWVCAAPAQTDTLTGLACSAGQVPRWDGSAWICSTTIGAVYSAGEGLALTGTQFSIPSSYQLPQNCAGGEMAQWDATAGKWACAATDAYTRAEVDIALAAKIDASEVYTTGQIDSQVTALQSDLAAKIDASEVYTAGQVDALLATKAGITATYTAVATATVALAVDWTDITNMPPGFADGTDSTDDTVSWSEISGIVGAGATNVAGGNHTHAYTGLTNGTGVYLEYKPNNIACADSQVLKWDAAGSRWVCGVGANGDITGVTAGTGLTGGGATGAVTLNVNLAGTGTAATVARSDHNHDTAYVNEGQANSVTSAMITNGAVTSADLQDGATLAEILDDDGSGSTLDADRLDGQDSTAFAASSHSHTHADPTNGAGVYLGYKPNNAACTANQVLKWDSTNSRWICGTDNDTGDITGVTAGTGLTGGGTTGAVTLRVDLAGSGSASTVARSDHNHDTTYYSRTQVDAALTTKLDAADHTWSGLAGVPAGFSDGTDDTDDTVSWSEISGIVGTGATSVAGGDHNHDSDYYTQGQVNTALAAKIDASEVYTTGQVDAALTTKLDAADHTWSGLAGVPAGFSDGTDDTDDTVSWSEISGIVGTGATSVAGGNHNHDSDYYTQGQVSTALAAKIDASEVYTTGQIDSQITAIQSDLALKIDASEVYTTGQVDAALTTKLDAADHTWSGLAGVPAGFSDGTDDTDDTVSWSEISGIVGTGATSVAGGNHNHDTAYVNEGQANSVNSAMITNGVVSSADLQDGAALAEILDDDGSGSTLDADKLDGQDSTAFAASNHSHTHAQATNGTGVYLGYKPNNVACTANQVLKWDNTNSRWICGLDNDTGDITGVTAGTGLTGGGASGAVTLNVNLSGTGTASTVARSDHDHDTAYVNEGQANSVTSAMITNGAVTSADLQDGATLAEILDDDGSGSTLDADLLDGQDGSYYWSAKGNAATASDFIGTTNSEPLVFKTNNLVGLRIDQGTGAATDAPAVIGGYLGNTAIWQGATIAGGGYAGNVNSAGYYGSVGGGYDNVASGDESTIGGGWRNQATAGSTTIGGGFSNTTSGVSSSVGGGTQNVASSSYATVSGGQSNTASGDSSAIGGGQSNTASANWGTVSGGYNNIVSSSYSTIGGGFGNQISSAGVGAAIPGGLNNAASGATSFAAGRQAKANHNGAFVWGDGTPADIASNADHSVTFRAAGGYRLFTNAGATTGASLAAGSGSWASMSDRNQKENLQPVDTQAVLEQVGQLPLSTWNYISQADDIRHIGPMAQDFHAAFGVGENETTITAIDADGVSLAAIQALYKRLTALEAENEALKARLEALEAE